ncbi:MAG TPA: phenylacetate-CoA oxygenase subunit PaaJ [Chitinophagaceae bacterium]|nr:phenylacetate-CoA oxygenase subunit PaaJ [Chitinophagaceae bacterium]
MVNAPYIPPADIWDILKNIPDPEIPVISITDLGIVRDVQTGGGRIVITITPTYSGCPAHEVIMQTIRMELLAHGYTNMEIKQALFPAWTTDWMTNDGKEKLRRFGIAPPNPVQQFCHQGLFAADETVQCPRCGSFSTKKISEFGSTACKALYQCTDCQEPFDYFKCH